MALVATTEPDGVGAPARWWLLVAAAAACVVLYLASQVSAFLLAEIGGRTLVMAVVAIAANVTLCVGTIALSGRIAFPRGGVPAGVIGRARSRRVGIAVLVQLGFIILLLPLLTALGDALGARGTTSVSLHHRHTYAVLLLTWMAVVAAPWMEELSMRGFLLSGLWQRFGFWPAAVMSSLVWASLHGVSGVLIPFTCEGILLCWIRRRTGSVRTGIALHAGQNTAASLFSGAGFLVAPALAAVVLSLVVTREGSAVAARQTAARALARAARAADVLSARFARRDAHPATWVLTGCAFAAGLVIESAPLGLGIGGAGLLTAGRIVIIAFALPLLAWLLLGAPRAWKSSAVTSLAGAAGCALVIAARLGVLLDSSALVPLVGLGYTLIGFGLVGLAIGGLDQRPRLAAGTAGLLMVATLTPLPYLTTTTQAIVDQGLLTLLGASAALVAVGLTLRRTAPVVVGPADRRPQVGGLTAVR